MKKIALGVLLTVATLLVGSNAVTAQAAESCYVFNNDLSYGMTFGEVLELQKFLAADGSFNVELTGTFGPLTRAALAQYQSKNGIQATGYFGPATRAHVNANCGQVLGAYDEGMAPHTVSAATAGSLKLLTPQGSEAWQMNNHHTISWTPNSDSSNIDAFFEVKKGKVYQKVSQLIPCGKGSIIWCIDVDTTPDNGVLNRSEVQPGSYYLSIMDKVTKQVDRTRNPIKIVKYGEVIKMSLTAHLDKTKKVNATDEATKITVKSPSVTLSWDSFAKVENCKLEIAPYIGTNPNDTGASTHTLARKGTKQTFNLTGGYSVYAISMVCSTAENNQQKVFIVTVEGAKDPVSIKVLSPNGGETFIADSSLIKIEGKVEGVADGTKVTAYLYHPENGYVRNVVGYTTTAGTVSMETSLEKGGGHNPGKYKITMCAEGYSGANGKDLCDSSDDYFILEAPKITTGNACQFEQDLASGSTRYDDVVRLSLFLESKGFLTIPAESHGTGYPKSAVAAYQAANGISPADGITGPFTRAHMNANCPSFVVANVVAEETSVSNGTGTFKFVVDVQAVNGDAYIQLNGVRNNIMSLLAARGFNYQILDANKSVTTAGKTTVTVYPLGKGNPGDTIYIPNGQVTKAQVEIAYTPDAPGSYYANLYSVNTSRTAGMARQQLLVRELSDAITISGVMNTLTVTKSGTGTGVVSGLSSGGKYNSGAVATLAATADLGSRFKGWTGACTGTAFTCSITMDANKSVNAIFDKSTHQGVVTVTKPASGESLSSGQSYNVQWNYKNPDVDSHAKYSIALVDSAGKVTTLFTSTATGVLNVSGDRTKAVTIPQSSPGQYVIRVTYMNSAGTYLTHDDSDKFNIGQTETTGAIAVLDIPVVDSDSEDGIGTFTYDLELTALRDDVYVPMSSGQSSDNVGFDWTVVGGSGISTISVQSDADTVGANFKIEEGHTELFTIVITVDPVASGSYYVLLNDVTYYEAIASNGNQTFAFSPSNQFDTPAVSIIAMGPQTARTARVAANTSSYSAIATLPNLSLGSTDPGVAMIQRFLNANGFAVNSVAGQPGSVGHEADYFGPATQRALAAYQASKGISPANGSFGPQTRAAMSQ